MRLFLAVNITQPLGVDTVRLDVVVGPSAPRHARRYAKLSQARSHLARALEPDVDYLRDHRQYLDRVVDWSAVRGRGNRRVLVGGDLLAASDPLAISSNADTYSGGSGVIAV